MFYSARHRGIQCPCSHHGSAACMCAEVPAGNINDRAVLSVYLFPMKRQSASLSFGISSSSLSVNVRQANTDFIFSLSLLIRRTQEKQQLTLNDEHLSHPLCPWAARCGAGKPVLAKLPLLAAEPHDMQLPGASCSHGSCQPSTRTGFSITTASGLGLGRVSTLSEKQPQTWESKFLQMLVFPKVGTVTGFGL